MFPRSIESIKKVLILAKMYIRYWKSIEIQNGKKSEVCEQNFTERKAIHYLYRVEQCAKLSFMIKNFQKWRGVMVLNFFNVVLKMYGKWFLKMCGNPGTDFWLLQFVLETSNAFFPETNQPCLVQCGKVRCVRSRSVSHQTDRLRTRTGQLPLQLNHVESLGCVVCARPWPRR